MQHAVRTEDESIWIHFQGEVPRIGEQVAFFGNNKEYIVTKVMWFISDNNESEARVWIEEKK
ncbi:hypothetical protein [Bdellovibrio sp. HCB288]|uniref:hypothetical protein n=1 Tax=Bdellovibrio sp. HCB288 TaxID=3394355 RepID=UPI0039B5E40F